MRPDYSHVMVIGLCLDVGGAGMVLSVDGVIVAVRAMRSPIWRELRECGELAVGARVAVAGSLVDGGAIAPTFLCVIMPALVDHERASTILPPRGDR